MYKDGLLKVEGYVNLRRDPISNCIINTDQEALDSAIKRREAEEQQKKDIENLKSEMTEVKSMLAQVLRILDNGSRNHNE